MNTYDFVLKFALPSDQDLSVVEERLYAAGCDDALLGLGQKGRVGLSFTRQAESAEAALHSALQDVKKALPTARLIEVGPDLVGVTDIAELFSFSRQNVRKLLQTHLDTFPLPVHEGRSAIWHLVDVLGWFERHQHKPIDQTLYEVAAVSCRTNITREQARLQTAC